MATDRYLDFEAELTKSEYHRSRLLVGVFIIGVLIVLVNFLVVGDEVMEFYGGTPTYFFSVSWFVVFIIYQLLVMHTIQRLNKQGKRVSNRFKVLQTFIEVSYISLLIFYMVDARDTALFIDSPVYLVYFIFITLSILHLDFRLSLLSAGIAAIQFGLIVYFAFHLAGVPARYLPTIPENGYYIRCFILILTGGVAGFVAEEVKRRVKSSLEFKMQKSEIELHLGQQVSKEILVTLTQDGGKMKKADATVLALDIRGFTKFAEGRSPDEIHDFQNKFFGPVLDIITQHRGVVNQILGDGIMATFGAPSPNPLHADMAFQAALRISEKVKELCRKGIIPETKIGMGIHSGEVITGNIGNENRKQYSISGKAVIIAFRVEQLNKDLGSELLITEEVRSKVVQGHVPITNLGRVALKGLENQVEVHKVG